MVDRGGLNYPIRVRDEFSKTTALFRKELRESKKEFRDFQKVVKGNKSAAKDIRDQARATKELARAQRDLSAATRSTVKPMTDEEKETQRLAVANRKLARQLDLASKAQRQRERTAIALRNAMQRDVAAEQSRVKRLEREAAAQRRVADSKNVEFQAAKKLNGELFREAVARKQIELLRARARSQFGQGDFRGGTETLRRSKLLERSLQTQLGTAQKLLFTFRRLVGALAIFTLARRGVQAFNDLVSSGIQFNDTIQTAQIGIAGLVVTLGDVRDAQGGAVSATEQLNLALGVARQQSALLRQDSLKTVATFEQLLDTFQVSVGPGIAAGLDIDEVRKLTVDISQAASALGVPQNQLAEEVRSLLSGTIQARTTRIATALGISNEDVRRLKETGELFDVLEAKFAGFNEAAQRQARETFSGISTLIRGITQEILGQASQPLFDELVALGNQAFDAFLSVQDAAGNIRPSPEVVAAFQQVFDALKRSVEAMKELGQGSAIGSLNAVMGTIAVAIDFVSGVAVGLVKTFTFLRDIVASFAEFLGVTSSNAGVAAQNVGSIAVQALLALKAIKLINVNLIRTSGLVLRILAPFAAVVKALEFIFSKVSGVNLNLKDTIEIVAVSLLGAFFELGGAISKLAQTISNAFGSAIDFVVSKAKSGALRALGFVQSELLFDDAGAQAFKDRAFAEEQAFEKARKSRENRNKLELADIEAQTKAKVRAIEDEIAQIVGARAAENQLGPSFDPSFNQGEVPGVGDITDGPEAGANGAQVFGRSRVDEDTLKRVQETTVLLEAQVNAERAKADAIARNATGRELALVSARNAVSLAEAELEKIREKNELELAPLKAQAETLAPGGAELANLNEVISALETRQGYEQEILSLRLAQLRAAEEEAELVANGSLTDGLREGFTQFSEEFSSTFQAGVQIAETALQGFTQFASQAIVDAFDPTKDSATIKENFARLLQQISQVILQKLIELAIAKLLIEAGFGGGGEDGEAGVQNAAKKGAIEISTATTVAAIRIGAEKAIAAIRIASGGGGFSEGGLVGGLAEGGLVPPHFGRKAQGLARGGVTKPAHIPASDTVPAWLTPGEFVMRRAAVKNIGLSTLEAMNGGNMSVVGSATAEAAGPSTGMAAGGLVSDRLAAASETAQASGEGSRVTVVPAVVAGDKQLDALTAGGRNAMLAFMRENAGNINSLLDRSNGRR